MEGGLAQPCPNEGLYGEAIVLQSRGDSVKAPFFRALHDKTWMVPVVILYSVAFGGSPLLPQVYVSHMRDACDREGRDPLAVEMAHVTGVYTPPGAYELLLPLPVFIQRLEGLAKEYPFVEATLKSLKSILAHSTHTHTPHFARFAQIGECSVVPELLREQYSLKRQYPQYFENGSSFKAQANACQAFFLNPPIGSGLRAPLTLSTIDIKLDSAQEFWGYLKKHEGLEPSFEHLGNTTLVARWVSFLEARSLAVNTVFMRLLDIKPLLPFCFFHGACPGCCAFSFQDRDHTLRWYKEVTTRYRMEASNPENKRRMLSTVHLHLAWDNLATQFAEVKADYEVGTLFWIFQCKCHL